MYPEAWRGIRKNQEGYGYGNRRPLEYIRALRQTRAKLQPKVHDQVQVKPWQEPRGSSLNVHGHAQIQNQPSPYHQSPYQPRSYVATKVTQEMSPSQHPLAKPRNFEFSLKIPFVDFLGQNKETSSTIKGSDLNSGGSDGAGHYSQLYRPSSVHISSSFNGASSSDGGFTNYPNGGKTGHEVTKPSFQLSLSVPIPPTVPSPKQSSSSGGYHANVQKPESHGFVQNSYIEPAKPDSSSTQSGSEQIFFNSAHTVQQQTEHQTYDPLQTKYTDRTGVPLSPGDASQHTTAPEQVSQGEIPAKQSPVFPEPSAPSLPVPQYPPLQSDNVPSRYYSAQINPLSNDDGEGQSGQTVSSGPTNAHLPLSPSQYERIPSRHYSAGPAKTNVDNYGQRQTWQPDGTPLTSDSEPLNYGQFKPSYEQNVGTVLHLGPAHPVAPSQYELPSVHQFATTDYNGKGNGVQIPTVATDSSSSPYQYSRDQSGQHASSGHLNTFVPSSNFHGLSTDYQAPMRLPEQNTGKGQLNGKTKYIKLYIDVDDVVDRDDGQQNYFAAPPTYYDGYSGTWTE